MNNRGKQTQDTPYGLLPATHCRFAAIDFESAGALPGCPDSPVQIGMATLEDNSIDPKFFFRSYLDPGRPVVWTAQKTHGISDTEVAGAPRLQDVWPRIRQTLGGRVVVAHGAPTEKRILRAFPGHGFGPWVDTLRLARAIAPNLPSHALEDVVAATGTEPRLRSLCPGLTWHDALFDAVACLVIIEFTLREFSSSAPLPLHALLEPDTAGYYLGRRRSAL